MEIVHFDSKVLARRILFLETIFQEIPTDTLQDALLWGAALERMAEDFKDKARRIAQEKETNS